MCHTPLCPTPGCPAGPPVKPPLASSRSPPRCAGEGEGEGPAHHDLFRERAKFIPLRLSQDERRLLRLLEAALQVNEYTDKVGGAVCVEEECRALEVVAWRMWLVCLAGSLRNPTKPGLIASTFCPVLSGGHPELEVQERAGAPADQGAHAVRGAAAFGATA